MLPHLLSSPLFVIYVIFENTSVQYNMSAINGIMSHENCGLEYSPRQFIIWCIPMSSNLLMRLMLQINQRKVVYINEKGIQRTGFHSVM